MAGSGWVGRESQLLDFLRMVGADQDEEGRFILDGGDVTVFLGGAGVENPDVVVPEEARYFVNGQQRSLASGLVDAGHGVGVTVI